MASDLEKAEWISRVLGIQVSAPDDGLVPRLAEAGRALQGLKAANDPAFPSLLTAFTEASAAVKGGTAEAPALVDALESSLARARSAARGRDAAAANPRSVNFTKLLLRWNEAQKRVNANLAQLGTAVLALDEVQADRRLPTVKEALKRLPTLVPQWGDQLDDALKDCINAGSGPAAAPAARAALAVLDEYREKLGGVPALSRLEAFSKRRLGTDLALYRELDGAMAELETRLAEVA